MRAARPPEGENTALPEDWGEGACVLGCTCQGCSLCKTDLGPRVICLVTVRMSLS